MITRKKLESVYELQKELKMWERKLEELRKDMSISSNGSDGMPGAGEPSSPTEMKAIKLMETTKAIEKKKREIKRTINEVLKYILNLEDSKLRMILQYRCVDCKSWSEIAELFGAGYTAENVRQRYNRHVKRLK